MPFASVYTILALITSWSTLRLSSPLDDAVMVKAAATALAVTAPVRVIALIAPVTLDAGIVAGRVIFIAPAVVGVPLMATVTTVALVRDAAVAVSPAGKPDTAKSGAFIKFT